jgi:hypothetical protein
MGHGVRGPVAAQACPPVLTAGQSGGVRPIPFLTPEQPLKDLAGLAGLRSAPRLEAGQQVELRRELESAMADCEWFTIGVMAPTATQAEAALRRCENALGWPPLVLQNGGGNDAAGEPVDGAEGPVFLKGNQRNGLFSLRQEAGLGEGILITGHSSRDPGAEGTWGPLPLDFFQVR